MSQQVSSASKAGVKSYRYIRFISTSNDNYAVKCNREDADVVGEYVTDPLGFPVHVRDWDITEAENIINASIIEKLDP